MRTVQRLSIRPGVPDATPPADTQWERLRPRMGRRRQAAEMAVKVVANGVRLNAAAKAWLMESEAQGRPRVNLLVAGDRLLIEVADGGDWLPSPNASSVHIGGPKLAAELARRGWRPGRYPATPDGRGRLMVERTELGGGD